MQVSRIRIAREVLLWATVLGGVLNFAPSLFSTSGVSAEPIWTKGVRDIPLVLLLVVTALEVVRTRPLLNPRARRWAGAIAVFALFMATSAAAIAFAPAGDAASARYYVVYPLVGLLTSLVDAPRAMIRRLVVLVVALGVGEALLAVPDFLVWFGPTYYGGAIPIGHSRYNRAIATLGNPNNLGLFLGLAMIFAAGAMTWVRTRVRIVLCCVLAVGLFLTFSKTAAVALALSTFVLMEGSRRRRLLATTLALAGATAFAVLSIVVRSGYHPLSPQVTATQPAQTGQQSGGHNGAKGGGRNSGSNAVNATVGTRGENLSKSLHRLTRSSETFLVGAGFATLGDVGANGKLSEYVVDDMPLGLALEGGVIGLMMFTTLVVFALQSIFERGSAPLVRAVRAYAVFFLLYTPIAVNFRLFPAAAFFWVFVGLAAAAHARPSRSRSHEGADRSPGTLAGVTVP